MSVDYLSVPITSTAADTIRAVAEATDMQPEAIVVAFCHDPDQRLVGAVSLVALVQSPPASTMEGLADPNPIHVHADADIDEITRAMADYNLLVLPVLDRDDHQIGVLTIDDILEAAIAPEHRRGQA
jgi:Mg/Co/Ni transporter MgtE